MGASVSAGAPAAFRRPTRDELRAAYGKRIPDVIAPGLDVLFVGINPSLYSAAVGHHFARPGNRFWPTLHASGFTPRLVSAFEDRELMQWGLGVTNVVAAATARADELTKAQLRGGGARLVAKARRYEPRVVAVLGVTAYRAAFGRPEAVVGEQPDPIGPSRAWVLPNPSGLNAHYQLPQLAVVFANLRAALDHR